MSTSSMSAQARGTVMPEDEPGSVTRNLNVAQPEMAGGPTSNGRGTASTAPEMEMLARALGWFSLGLGLAQIAAPSKVAQLIGVEDDDNTVTMMRVVGAREIASGIGILTQSKPTPWLWSRVGGDAMDLALLRSAMASPRADQHRIATATAAVFGIAAVDTLCSTRLAAEPDTSPQQSQHPGEVPVKSAITVNAPIDQVYAAWEGFQSLPRFMKDLASVEITSERRSHWQATLPGGISIDWDTEITETVPNESITWRTSDDSRLDASGQVRFRPAPGNRGTEILFDARFNPPGGELGSKIGGLFSDALGQKVHNDLRRSKQLIEIGEIVQSDDSVVPGPNPAQPVETGKAA